MNTMPIEQQSSNISRSDYQVIEELLTQPHSNLPNRPYNCKSSTYPTILRLILPDDVYIIPIARLHPLRLFWVHPVVERMIRWWVMRAADSSSMMLLSMMKSAVVKKNGRMVLEMQCSGYWMMGGRWRRTPRGREGGEAPWSVRILLESTVDC